MNLAYRLRVIKKLLEAWAYRRTPTTFDLVTLYLFVRADSSSRVLLTESFLTDMQMLLSLPISPITLLHMVVRGDEELERLVKAESELDEKQLEAIHQKIASHSLSLDTIQRAMEVVEKDDRNRARFDMLLIALANAMAAVQPND